MKSMSTLSDGTMLSDAGTALASEAHSFASDAHEANSLVGSEGDLTLASEAPSEQGERERPDQRGEEARHQRVHADVIWSIEGC